MKTVRETGLLPYAIGRKYGGLGMPATTERSPMEMVSAVMEPSGLLPDVLTLTETIENMVQKSKKTNTSQRWQRNVIRLQWLLTEPDYGSDFTKPSNQTVKDAKADNGE